ncbi:hypothetical protein ACFL2V_03190 [Pseudomonadota bacterium]
MEMWGVIQIASLLLIVVLVFFMWRADSKINKLQDKLDNKDEK